MAYPAFILTLNGPFHKTSLRIFLFIVLAHWMEHIFQAVQIFVLHWQVPDSRGALGEIWPWLVTSEWMHYIYALVMLVGLVVLYPGFKGISRTWWKIALVIQFWHHIEHALLLYQMSSHHFLFGKTVPTSVLQLFFPRVELHLFYNTIVFVPMIIGMLYHMYPPKNKPQHTFTCSCSA